MKENLTKEIVYSPINDHRIKAELINSPIWKLVYTKEEVTEELIKKHKGHMYVYTIKFDGLTPVQHMGTKKFK